ncbi:hypothetical protein AAFF_G00142830 [Aldrovandia affinis]|uniref:Uncharacterized protein n=1 Tax=Aldrovandia affinis TaxID=143900 RepID=A0AAD7WWD0_9TELE|nr:hypothetical protein AAFF_G00142830 [Aldrovandia affinis]
MEPLIKQLKKGHAAQLEHNQALMEEQRQQTTLLRMEVARLSATANPRQPNPSAFIVKMTAEDDVETYLNTFERTATRERWAPGQWAGLIAPFLSGAAQHTYQDLDEVQAADYPVLKRGIMRRAGHSLIGQAQKFHNWTFDATLRPRAQMHDLIRLTKSWMTDNESMSDCTNAQGTICH